MADPVTPPVHPLHNRGPKFILALVLLLAIGLGAAFWYQQANKPTANTEQTIASLDEVSNEDDQLAITQLKEVYDDAATQEGKADAAFFLAARYSLVEDHGNALKYYREAARLGLDENIDVILGVAGAAEAVDNRQLARDYYQKALDYYTPLAENDLDYEDLVVRFQAKLKELED